MGDFQGRTVKLPEGNELIIVHGFTNNHNRGGFTLQPPGKKTPETRSPFTTLPMVKLHGGSWRDLTVPFRETTRGTIGTDVASGNMNN